MNKQQLKSFKTILLGITQVNFIISEAKNNIPSVDVRFYGPVGCGKTRSMLLTAEKNSKRGQKIFFFDPTQEINKETPFKFDKYHEIDTLSKEFLRSIIFINDVSSISGHFQGSLFLIDNDFEHLFSNQVFDRFIKHCNSLPSMIFATQTTSKYLVY